LFLLVGLGNPGMQYALTRHNVGFWVIDEIASRAKVSLKKVCCQSYIAQTSLAGKKVILAKPLTYMNRSGLAVRGLLQFFSLQPDNLLVIYDDLDLPLGRLRLRSRGGSGGHRGMASIIALLGNENFARVRLGIDRPGGLEEGAGYVLAQQANPFRRLKAQISPQRNTAKSPYGNSRPGNPQRQGYNAEQIRIQDKDQAKSFQNSFKERQDFSSRHAKYIIFNLSILQSQLLYLLQNSKKRTGRQAGRLIQSSKAWTTSKKVILEIIQVNNNPPKQCCR
jgi:PTH1 family peptidyl-tRNA hydrolase